MLQTFLLLERIMNNQNISDFVVLAEASYADFSKMENVNDFYTKGSLKTSLHAMAKPLILSQTFSASLHETASHAHYFRVHRC